MSQLGWAARQRSQNLHPARQPFPEVDQQSDTGNESEDPYSSTAPLYNGNFAQRARHRIPHGQYKSPPGPGDAIQNPPAESSQQNVRTPTSVGGGLYVLPPVPARREKLVRCNAAGLEVEGQLREKKAQLRPTVPEEGQTLGHGEGPADESGLRHARLRAYQAMENEKKQRREQAELEKKEQEEARTRKHLDRARRKSTQLQERRHTEALEARDTLRRHWGSQPDPAGPARDPLTGVNTGAGNPAQVQLGRMGAHAVAMGATPTGGPQVVDTTVSPTSAGEEPGDWVQIDVDARLAQVLRLLDEVLPAEVESPADQLALLNLLCRMLRNAAQDPSKRRVRCGNPSFRSKVGRWQCGRRILVLANFVLQADSSPAADGTQEQAYVMLQACRPLLLALIRALEAAEAEVTPRVPDRSTVTRAPPAPYGGRIQAAQAIAVACPDAQLRAWLQTLQLEGYTEALVQQGYDLSVIFDLEARQLEEMCTLAGFKPGHRAKLVNAVGAVLKRAPSWQASPAAIIAQQDAEYNASLRADSERQPQQLPRAVEHQQLLSMDNLVADHLSETPEQRRLKLAAALDKRTG